MYIYIYIYMYIYLKPGGLIVIIHKCRYQGGTDGALYKNNR